MTRDALGALVFAALGLAGIVVTQPSLARSLHDAKDREDVYVLPPPTQLEIGTLGYRAAAVDMLWAKLRVEYGMHFLENRRFPDVTHYIDALIALEPDFPPVYKYADTMLCYHAGEATEDDARKVRAYLERGLEARPEDHEIWLRYGQFLAFMSPSFLKSTDEIERWRVDGAAALQRAVELGDDPDRSIASATLLDNHGQREAAVRALERAYAMTDDPDEREKIAVKLARLHADDVRDRASRDVAFIEQRWRSRWPFAKRVTALLLGPAPDPLACVGPKGAHTPDCATDWDPVLPSSKAP